MHAVLICRDVLIQKSFFFDMKVRDVSRNAVSALGRCLDNWFAKSG